MSNTFLFAFGIFVAQHGPNIGLKPSETRKTPPLALLIQASRGRLKLNNNFLHPRPETLKWLPFFHAAASPKKSKKGIEIHTLASKCMPFFRAANPPDKSKKGMEIHTCAPKCIPFFHSANPPDNFKKGIRNPHFYCNVSPMMIFFWKLSGSATLFFQCFFL